MAVVRPPVANLHAQPSLRSELVSQALMGTPVGVLRVLPAWVLVRCPDGYEGWMDSGALGPPAPCEGPVAVAAEPLVNLRVEPSSRSAPTTTISLGTALPVSEAKNGWIGVRLPSGAVAWAEAHRLATHRPPASGDRIVATALLLLGTPYLWGGTSAFGVDCSGLVQLVFGFHGVRLPRDAHQQAEATMPIGAEQPRAGTLAFFAPQPDAPASEVDHVGLCTGDGRLVHAQGGGRVVCSPLSDPQLATRLWGFRQAAELANRVEEP